MSAGPRYLLVDGHSVLFAVRELAGMHRRNQRQARLTLRAKLERLHDTTLWRVTLVFDGRRGKGEEEVSLGTANPMVVIYSAEHQTADSIIERLTMRTEDPGLVTVVTADGAERLTVEAAGAEVRSPEWLMEECAAAEREWKQGVDRVLSGERRRGLRLFD